MHMPAGPHQIRKLVRPKLCRAAPIADQIRAYLSWRMSLCGWSAALLCRSPGAFDTERLKSEVRACALPSAIEVAILWHGHRPAIDIRNWRSAVALAT